MHFFKPTVPASLPTLAYKVNIANYSWWADAFTYAGKNFWRGHVSEEPKETLNASQRSVSRRACLIGLATENVGGKFYSRRRSSLELDRHVDGGAVC